MPDLSPEDLKERAAYRARVGGEIGVACGREFKTDRDGRLWECVAAGPGNDFRWIEVFAHSVLPGTPVDPEQIEKLVEQAALTLPREHRMDNLEANSPVPIELFHAED